MRSRTRGSMVSSSRTLTGTRLSAAIRALTTSGACFQMTAQCLSTQTRFGLNPIVFVIDNGVYGVEQWLADASVFHADKPFYRSCILHPWNYSKLAEVFGCQGWKASTYGELRRPWRAPWGTRAAHPSSRSWCPATLFPTTRSGRPSIGSSPYAGACSLPPGRLAQVLPRRARNRGRLGRTAWSCAGVGCRARDCGVRRPAPHSRGGPRVGADGRGRVRARFARALIVGRGPMICTFRPHLRGPR